MLTVASVMTRLHEINGQIAGVNAERYYVSAPDSVKFPYIFALPRGRRVNTRDAFSDDRTYELTLVLGNWMSAIPTVSMQARAETYIDTVIETYAKRPRLSIIEGGAPLDYVTSTRWDEDDGIQPDRNFGDLAAVYFRLVVTYSSYRQQECW